MLELHGLHKRYGAIAALDGVGFSVRPGRMLGFLGPNGAGKTTSMRAVFGLVRLDSGSVHWNGRPVGEDTRRSFGYLPEQRGLYPRMRVRDQLVYLARLHGMRSVEATEASDRWLERFGLAGRARDRLEELSHGNQQRVQLAAALVHRPTLLVLDEPFSGLDPIGVDDMAAILREEAAGGTAVVFSSHQLDLVEDLCQDVAIIAAGRLVLEGDVDQLKHTAPVRILEVEGPRIPAGLERVPGVHSHRRDGRRNRYVLDASVPTEDLLSLVGSADHFAHTPPTLEDLFREAVGNGEAASRGSNP